MPPSTMPSDPAASDPSALFRPGTPGLSSVRLAAGEALFAEGDPDDALYRVESGRLAVRRAADGAGDVDRLEAGDLVGELAVLTGQRRSASVVALTPAILLRLPRAAYEREREATPDLDGHLAEQAVPRWQRDLLAAALRELFVGVDVVRAHGLQDRVRWRTLASGEAACRQGDVGDALYVIVSGRVLFEVEGPDGTARVVGEAGAGEAVGEFALLTDARRSASVVAARETSLVEIGRELFAELVGAHPQLLFSIARTVAERQRQAHHHGSAALETGRLTVTLLALDPALDVGPLARDLVGALGRIGEARLLDAAAVDAAIGPGASAAAPGDPHHAAVVQWLNEQEAAAGTLVFVPDEAGSAWATRCLSRSDRALFVGRPDGDAALSEPERQLEAAGARVRRALVLWHPPGTERPTGTARWLTGREGYDLHHIREGDAAHVGRLARHVAGVAVGLVLGGGGARGYAHYGAVEALEEAGVPVDAVGGASFGALAAATVAMSEDHKAAFAANETLARNDLVFDRTVPIVALNRSRRLTQLCKRLYGDLQIEDLWVPYFAVAVNLSLGEPITIRRGPLWRAVRTSIAVPGIFTPIVEDGQILIDGAVMNNLPVDVMMDVVDTDRVVCVNLEPGQARASVAEIGPSISGWRVLWERLNPFAKRRRLPLLSSVVSRTLFVGSRPRSAENAQRAALHLALDLPGLSLLNFDNYRAAHQMGYDQTGDAARAWRATQPDLAEPPAVAGPIAEPVAA